MNTTRRLHRTGRLLLGTLAAIGLATVSVGGTASAGSTQGEALLDVTYFMPAAVGQSAADALEPELFLSGSDISDTASRCTESDTATPEFGSLTRDLNCNLEPGREHVIGVDMLPPDHYVAFVSCRPVTLDEAIDLPDATLTLDPFTITECDVFIEPFPTVYIDKVTTGGGPLDSTDFTLEIYDDAGALVDGTLVDPSTDTCALFDLDDTTCASIVLPPGDSRWARSSCRTTATTSASVRADTDTERPWSGLTRRSANSPTASSPATRTARSRTSTSPRP